MKKFFIHISNLTGFYVNKITQTPILVYLLVLYDNFNIFSDCEQVYQCYKIYYNNWVSLKTDGAVTNIWCEHYCKDAGANYQYSGTIVSLKA